MGRMGNDMRTINLIVVHCSATKASHYIGAEDIRRWHVDDNGWSDIGYHFVIKRDGEVDPGRPVDRAGAHCYGHNKYSIGICMVGGIDRGGEPENNFNPIQFDALLTLIRELKDEYPIDDICGHRDLSPDVDGDGEVEQHEWVKACPCFDVREYLTDRL